MNTCLWDVNKLANRICINKSVAGKTKKLAEYLLKVSRSKTFVAETGAMHACMRV